MRIPIVVMLAVITSCSMLVFPDWSHASSGEEISTMSPNAESDTQPGRSSGTGMKAASAVATILYFPFKAAFAIGGGIVGGLSYVFSGFNEPTAKRVWVPSMTGTYVITPDHLPGNRPIHFLGVAAESEGMQTMPNAMTH